MEWKKLAPPLATIVLTSLIGVWVVTYIYRPESKQLGMELVKALIQISTVLVVGQIVSILIESARYKRQQSEAINKFRKEILGNLIRTLTATKKARRLLRAKAVRPSPDDNRDDILIHRDIYNEQMQILNDVQLELETIKQEVKTSIDTSSNAFTNPHELKRSINSIESYLRKIVNEYEEKFKDFRGDPSSMPLSELESLKDFIGFSDENSFAKKTLRDYVLAMKLIRGDILTDV